MSRWYIINDDENYDIDYLERSALKDREMPGHKWIERWRDQFGKWQYSYNLNKINKRKAKGYRSPTGPNAFTKLKNKTKTKIRKAKYYINDKINSYNRKQKYKPVAKQVASGKRHATIEGVKNNVSNAAKSIVDILHKNQRKKDG